MDSVDGGCLFSFELLVKSIEYISVPCVLPAVGFRLLDYPTVITYFTSLLNIDKMRQKLGGYVQNNEVLVEMNKFKNESNGYDFNKGKSCLFQHGFQSLNKLLHNVPLYIMLLDSWAEKPKLVGSCMVPLQKLMIQINQVFEEFGENCPAVANRTGHYNICNLMGTNIGKINVELKLTCFGQSLLRHVQLGGTKEPQINMLLNLKNVQSSKKKVSLQEEQYIPHQKIDHIILPADGTTVCTDTNAFKSESKYTQCSQRKEKRRNKVKRKLSREENEAEGDLFFNNIICPPPLCLNLHEPFIEKVGIRSNKPKHKEKFILENDLNSYDSISSDEEPDVEILKPMSGRKSCYHVVRLKENIKPISTVTNNMVNENEQKNMSTELAKMPVLCTLLKEICNLTNSITNNENGLKTFDKIEKIETVKLVEDDPVKTTQNVEKIVRNTCHSKDKSPHLVSHARMDCPKKIASSKKPIKSRRKLLSNDKRDSKRNSKLTYGMTRTQKLRYKLTHHNELLPNNSIELHDQLQPVKYDLQNISNVLLDSDTNKLAVQSMVDYGSLNQKHKLDINPENEIEETKNTSPERAISVLIPTPDYLLQNNNNNNEEHVNSGDAEDSFHNQIVPPKPGFYSPAEPRSISISELGVVFDDQSPWTSITRSRDQLSHDYDDDSFHSDHTHSTITATSSISLPNISDSNDQSTRNLPSSRNSRYSSNSRNSAHVGKSASKTDRPISEPDRPISARSGLISSRKSTAVISSRISSAHSVRTNSRHSIRTNSSVARTDTSRSNEITRTESYTSEASIETEKHRSGSNVSNRSSNGNNPVRNKEPIISAHSPAKSKNIRKKKTKTSDEKLLNESVRTLSSSK